MRAGSMTATMGIVLAAWWLTASDVTLAQQAQQATPAPATKAAAAPAAPAASAAAASALPSSASDDYVIGQTDVLSIVFWGEKDLSSDVTVRPDGKISMPLLNDVVAAGLTPEQLRRVLLDRAKKFFVDSPPEVTVVVKQVNNNRAFVTGQVARPGPYVLTGPTTVLQVLAMAGGFTEFADKKRILITRVENGEARFITFNYDEMLKRQDPKQNVVLKAGDTIVVP